MRVEDFKRWHWIVIGLVAGLVLSYLYASVEPHVPRSIGQDTFERDLVRKLEDGTPFLSSIVVYPPKENVSVVTGRQLDRVRGARDEWVYKPFSFWVKEPFQPRRNAPEGTSTMPIEEYLSHVASQHDHVSYSYAWWRQTPAIYTMWTLGAVLVIGGLWPTLVNVLIGAGLGRKSEPEPEYDLERFGQYKEAETAKAKADMSQEELDQLRAVEAELERRLAEGGGVGVDRAAASAAMGEPVRKLEAGPLEASQANTPKEDKSYGGEFYPTVAHAPKKKSE